MIENIWNHTKVLKSQVERQVLEGLLLDDETIEINEMETLLWLWLNANNLQHRRYAEVKLNTLKCICGSCYLQCLCHKPEFKK